MVLDRWQNLGQCRFQWDSEDGWYRNWYSMSSFNENSVGRFGAVRANYSSLMRAPEEGLRERPSHGACFKNQPTTSAIDHRSASTVLEYWTRVGLYKPKEPGSRGGDAEGCKE